MQPPRSPAQLEAVRAACLSIAAALDSLLDEIVVVGGLVPALLTGSSETGESSRAYPGTVDLDLGLSLGVGDEIRLKQLAERLVAIGLRQLATVQGRPIRERWITQTLVRPLPAGLAAFVVPGLELAFGDRVRVRVSGRDMGGAAADRDLWVCGPAAFVVLKALAWRARADAKDAYGIFYLLRHWAPGLADIADRLRRLGTCREIDAALEILAKDFPVLDARGPSAVAHFLGQDGDDALRADASAIVGELVRLYRRPSP